MEMFILGLGVGVILTTITTKVVNVVKHRKVQREYLAYKEQLRIGEPWNFEAAFGLPADQETAPVKKFRSIRHP